jgi:enoyl-CoA hydratase
VTGAHQESVLVSWPSPDIGVVTLNRPERLNALTHDVVDALVARLTEAGGAPKCRVLVLTGAGRGFCAGLDIAANIDADADVKRSLPVRMAGQEKFASMIRTIRTLRQPVIAAVNGAAAGAGLGLALACDVRVAAASASFHVAAVKIGLSAGECGISYHLPRHIGTSRAFEHMLTGRPIPAADAERYGLVSRVVPDGEVLGAALDIAREIAANSPFAVWQTKQVMRNNIDADFEGALAVENRAQILAVHTDDAGEAMRAFVEKRAPTFTGT